MGNSLNLPVIKIDYCSEGGDRDYCGGGEGGMERGSILLASSVVETNRNPNCSVEEVLVILIHLTNTTNTHNKINTSTNKIKQTKTNQNLTRSLRWRTN